MIRKNPFGRRRDGTRRGKGGFGAVFRLSNQLLFNHIWLRSALWGLGLTMPKGRCERFGGATPCLLPGLTRSSGSTTRIGGREELRANPRTP
jgi:hypothetical protein